MQERSAHIKSELRRRILLHNSDQNLVLYEGKLAQEFGVSRTPIRQVIQALASESLVEVRSGIGTIAPPLPPERRSQDMNAYAAILVACAACAQATRLKMVKIEFATLRLHLEVEGDKSKDIVFFEVATRFIVSLCDLVDDSILENALIACFWRFIRRRINDHKGEIKPVILELIETIKDIERCADSGNVKLIFNKTSESV